LGGTYFTIGMKNICLVADCTRCCQVVPQENCRTSAASFDLKGDDMRQAPPSLGRGMLARIVLEPFGMEPSRRRPCQFISELIFTPARRPSVGATPLTG